MTDITENFRATETIESKTQSTDKGNNSYSGDPVDHIAITASGNANIQLTVGDKGKVEKNEKRDTATEEEVDSSFSVDYYLRAIPTTGWALILFLLLALMGMAWWLLKTTVAGKAFDSAIAKGLEITAEGIDIVRDKLADAQKGSDLHSELQNELARLRQKEGNLKAQMKHKR